MPQDNNTRRVAPWWQALQRILPPVKSATGFEEYEAPEPPEMYTGGDPNVSKVAGIASGMLSGLQRPQLPTPPPAPAMFRRPTTMDSSPFRSQQPPVLGANRPDVVAGPGVSGIQGGLGMTRTPGGVGQEGPAWAQQRSGYQTPTPPLRSMEELFRIGFPQAGVGTAPGAPQLAQQQLKERVGDDEFERLLGQKQREIPAIAEAGLHPSVQRQQEATARRAAYPSQAQAQGLGNQALYNFLGRRETAAGTESRAKAQRDASALSTLERAMSAIGERETLTPEDQAELNRLRESIELVRRGVFFASDLFDEAQLDEWADLEQGFGLDELP